MSLLGSCFHRDPNASTSEDSLQSATGEQSQWLSTVKRLSCLQWPTLVHDSIASSLLCSLACDAEKKFGHPTPLYDGFFRNQRPN